MAYSLKQAADAVGKTRPTILRAIQSNKISAIKDAHGQWQIEPAELHRVYAPIPDVHERETEQNSNVLEREVALLRELVADLREDRDRWRTQAEKLLLTDQRSQPIIAAPPATAAAAEPETEVPASTTKARSWWRFGKR
jgi:hypothetical protein